MLSCYNPGPCSGSFVPQYSQHSCTVYPCTPHVVICVCTIGNSGQFSHNCYNASDSNVMCSEEDAICSDEDAICSDEDAIDSDGDGIYRDEDAICSDEEASYSEEDAIHSDEDAICSDEDAIDSDGDGIYGDEDAICSDDDASYSEEDAIHSDEDAICRRCVQYALYRVEGNAGIVHGCSLQQKAREGKILTYPPREQHTTRARVFPPRRGALKYTKRMHGTLVKSRIQFR